MASTSTVWFARIAIGLFTLSLALVTSVEAKKDKKQECDDAKTRCAKALGLAHYGCSWADSSECVFKVMPLVFSKQKEICERFEDYNSCWRDYQFHDCEPDRTRKDFEVLFKQNCDINKNEIMEAKSCAEKDETKKCVKNYREFYGGSKPCDVANTFAKCVEKAFHRQNCTSEARKAFIHGYTKPLLHQGSVCDVKLNAAGAPAGSAWLALVATGSLLGLALI